MHPFSTDRAKATFAAAVAAVEGASAAEVVVAVRQRTRDWLVVDLAVGAVIGWLALLFCLFAPPELSALGIAAIMPVATVAGIALSRALGSARLVLVPGSVLSETVRTAAKACFVDLGVASTRGRTGCLVFVALEERRVEVVPDVGVLGAVDRAEWNERVMAIVHTLEHAGMGEAGVDALAQAVGSLTATLRRSLPRAADDVNELEDLA